MDAHVQVRISKRRRAKERREEEEEEEEGEDKAERRIFRVGGFNVNGSPLLGGQVGVHYWYIAGVSGSFA